MSAMSTLRTKLLRPKIVVPVVLGAGMVVAIFALADARKVIAVILGFQRRYLLYFLLLMILYEVLRCAQWSYLLRSLGIRASLRSQIFSFSVGEITKSLPIGNYFQNYMLRQSQGTNFGRSSVATSLILLTEVVVSLLGVLLLGLGMWTDWLRPTILIGGAVVVGLVALAWALYPQLRGSARTPRWMLRYSALRRVVAEFAQYRSGVGEVARPQVLAVQMLLSALYLTTAGVGLYMLARGVGVDWISVQEVLAVYFFSLAIGLIVPIPVDIGLIEISGVGALAAVGVSRDVGLGIMLLNRIVSLCSATLIALVVIAWLRDELRASLREKPREAPRPLPSSQPSPRIEPAQRRG